MRKERVCLKPHLLAPLYTTAVDRVELYAQEMLASSVTSAPLMAARLSNPLHHLSLLSLPYFISPSAHSKMAGIIARIIGNMLENNGGK